MKLLESSRLKIPRLFLVSSKEELAELPIGIPFIYGDSSIEEYIVRLLEYEVLYQNAIKTGFPFDFKKILKDNGFDDITDFSWHETVYMDYTTEGIITEDLDISDFHRIDEKSGKGFKEFVKDSSCYVDMQILKNLNVFPTWLNDIEEAIRTNIHNFAVFNSNMYNKKLEGMYGGIELSSPPRNLIIIDISGSIPKAVSSTTLTLAKNLGETFYADLLITGSKSTLYLYEELHRLNVETIYNENGTDNDQTYFKNLVTLGKKIYKTAIVFGDNHSPCYPWSNKYNKKTLEISREDGKELCLWEVDNVISLHTTSDTHLAGYADWFSPTNIQYVKDWVKYLN